MDIFDFDGRVVDQNSYGQRQAAQGHDVDGLAQRAHDTYRNQDRKRDGNRDDHRTAPASQKQQNQRSGEARGDNRLADYATHGGAYKDGLVRDRLDFQFTGKRRRDRGQRLAHLRDDIERGSLPDLHDGHQHAARSATQDHIGLRRKSIPNVGDVADVDGGVVDRLDREIVQLADTLRAAVHVHVIFELPDLGGPGGQDQILSADGIDHIRRRQSLGLQEIRPDIDHHLALFS